MSEVTLTAEEAGVLLAVLQSCDWDEPLLPGLIERLAETREIVLRTPEHADEDTVPIPAVALDPELTPVGTMIDIMRCRRGYEDLLNIGLKAGGELEISKETACRIVVALKGLISPNQ